MNLVMYYRVSDFLKVSFCDQSTLLNIVCTFVGMLLLKAMNENVSIYSARKSAEIDAKHYYILCCQVGRSLNGYV